MQTIPQPIEQGVGTETDSVCKGVMKTMSWRIVATTTTFVISWIVTGSVLAGGAIASIEFWAKLALYYAHERAWARTC
jgi:uncharacterized membrane protein